VYERAGILLALNQLPERLDFMLLVSRWHQSVLLKGDQLRSGQGNRRCWRRYFLCCRRWGFLVFWVSLAIARQLLLANGLFRIMRYGPTRAVGRFVVRVPAAELGVRSPHARIVCSSANPIRARPM